VALANAVAAMKGALLGTMTGERLARVADPDEKARV
jgi:hypothetical protein